MCRGVQARRPHAAINLLVEGNWLPISNVLVNQVGKFRYPLYAPHENTQLNVLVDIQLISRTKVISVHSPVWLENRTARPLTVWLRVPPNLLAAPPPAAAAPAAGGARPMPPLPPAAGRYLPLAALLDGELSIAPEGAFFVSLLAALLDGELSIAPEGAFFVSLLAALLDGELSIAPEGTCFASARRAAQRRAVHSLTTKGYGHRTPAHTSSHPLSRRRVHSFGRLHTLVPACPHCSHWCRDALSLL